jgi:signal transduction histidine kinase
MLRAMRFRRRLTFGGMVLLILAAAGFLLASHSVRRAEEMNYMVGHTQEVLWEIDAVRGDRAKLRTSFYAFQETRSPAYLSDFEVQKKGLESGINRLRALTADNPKQQRVLDQLGPAVQKEMDSLENALHESTPPAPRTTALPDDWPTEGSSQKSPNRLFEELENEETTLFHARSLALEQITHRTQDLLLASSVLTIFLLIAAGYLIQREVMTRAKVEFGLRRAQEILGVRNEEQRQELDHLIEDLHAQIRARRSAEEELRHLNEELESRVESRTAQLREVNGELEAFTYSVSHDLRAPLRHMDGFSRILQQEFGPQLPQQAQHYLERVRDASAHMSALVEDLLHLSRVGRQPPRPQPTSLQRIVEEAREEILPEADGRTIEWKFSSLPEVEGDPLLLRQVFSNLFSNAVKFTRKQPAAVIEVQAHEGNDKVIVSVSDNGAGFDPRYADKLFGVFQRLHRQEEYEGTGIGLAMVQRIVHKHGGRIWAESKPGQGATFYFALPVAGKELAPEPSTIEAAV